jgi:aminoglycoside phosphotransferase (APT) family kinase protein
MAMNLDALLGRIRSDFPDLTFETARLSPTGEDHAVVILDEAWAFRFPRTLEQAAWFQTEAGLLRALAGRTSIATPDYRYLAPDGAFGGYPLIHGEEMSFRAFAALPRADQEAILVQLADFLSTLHALPADLLTRTDGARRTNAGWAREAVGQYFAHTRAVIARAGRLARAINGDSRYSAAHLWPELTRRLDAVYPAGSQ